MDNKQSNASQNLSLQKGTRLSERYLIQETISASTTSTVYQARDLHFPNVVKLVAVKEMFNPTSDLQEREEKVLPPALIDGRLLMSTFKLDPGPRIGELLEAVREAQAMGEVGTRKEALNLVQELLEKE